MRDFETNLPAIILEGLYFDVLIGVYWIKSLKAIINIEKSLTTNGNKTIVCGFWPKLSAFMINALCEISFKVAVNISVNSEVK